MCGNILGLRKHPRNVREMTVLSDRNSGFPVNFFHRLGKWRH
jgi:hypothetical protein